MKAAAAAPEEEEREDEQEEGEKDPRSPGAGGTLEHERWTSISFLLCGAIICMLCGNKCNGRMPGRRARFTTFTQWL